VHLHPAAGNPAQHLAAEQLGRRRAESYVAAVVITRGGVEHRAASRPEFGIRPGEHRLNELALADGAAALLARGRVGD
jgi:hypothetical protein